MLECFQRLSKVLTTKSKLILELYLNLVLMKAEAAKHTEHF